MADRIEKPIREALEMAGLSAKELHAVEMVGGGTRVPVIKKKIAEVLGTDLKVNYMDGNNAACNIQDVCVRACELVYVCVMCICVRMINASRQCGVLRHAYVLRGRRAHAWAWA